MINYKQVTKVLKELGIKIYPNNPSLYGLVFIPRDKNKDYSIFSKKDMWFSNEHKEGILIGLYSFNGDEGISIFDKKDKEGYNITDERFFKDFKSEEEFKKWLSKKLDNVKKFLNSLPDFSFKVGDKVRRKGTKETGVIHRIRTFTDGTRGVFVKWGKYGYKTEVAPEEIVKAETVKSSTESKVFAYHGQIITASSKQEAIQKIISK